jgi:outer membrane protein insertion porin family
MLPLVLGHWPGRCLRRDPLSISDIRVEGLQRISPGSVFNDIPIKVNDRVDDAAIAETARALFKLGQFRRRADRARR